MPITTDLGGKNYVLGRGRVFFDRFADNIAVTATTRGEGERYLGNTPTVSTTSSSEKYDHYDSESGIKTKDLSVTLSVTRTGTFECDNISKENLALYFSGTSSILNQAAATGTVETIIGCSPDRFYQLGVSPTLPSGVRKVSNVVVKKGVGFTTTVTQAGNYEVDEATGRVFILATSPDIPANTSLQFTYDVATSTREVVISKNQSVYGALRFVAANPVGVNRDIYMPYVSIAPDGDYSLKGDEVQKVGFSFEILKKADSIEGIYVDGRPA